MTHSDNPFTEIPKKLYQALNDRDYKSMWKLYAMDATFSDPAYGSLKGDEIKAMWHQICVRNTDLEAEILSVTQNDAQTISYSWKASYTHAMYNGEIENVINGEITVDKNGNILSQHETYSLWKWFSMAIGIAGKLLGWRTSMRENLQRSVRKSLDDFMEKKSYKP
jgi:hypothetical protein